MADRKVPPPRGRAHIAYSKDADFIRDVMVAYQLDWDADDHNREPALEDIQFVIGDQWEPAARARRNRLRKPTLTINRLPAFVAQYLGAFRRNDVTVKLTPARSGTKAAAEVRQGLIRTITRTREAKNALNTAATSQYICGIGNFAVDVVEAENDVFLRDIVLTAIADPFAVVWDRNAKDPTGADARRCFVTEVVERDEFDATWPGHENDAGWPWHLRESTANIGAGHNEDDMVRVCHFWQMRAENVLVGLEAGTGDVIDIDPDLPDDEKAMLVESDNDGKPMLRTVQRPYAERWTLTAQSVLDGPYRLDIPRLPVFRMEGWTLQEANARFRWGFVRNAKDPQRLHNYWRSSLAEELQRSSAMKWFVDQAGGGKYNDVIREAHLSGDPIIPWNSQESQAPVQLPPPPVNAALLTQAQMTVEDLKDVTNTHEAAMGQTSNERSGKAITARQRVSELGNVIYEDNAAAAIAECGKVLNALLPLVFDTRRIVRVTGPDDAEVLQTVNDEFDDATPDITAGKYDVSYDVGPSYASKRQETVDVVTTLMNHMPQVANVAADILVRNLDIPGSEELEERMASLLPPGMVNLDRLQPSQRARIEEKQKQQAQAAEQQQQITMAQIKAQLAEQGAKTMDAQARAALSSAKVQEVAQRLGIDWVKLVLDVASVEIDAYTAGMTEQQAQLDALERGLTSAIAEQSARSAPQGEQASG